MKKNIVLYAPPAAGKGTECEHLHSKYGYDVISIGAVLRNQRQLFCGERQYTDCRQQEPELNRRGEHSGRHLQNFHNRGARP